MEGGERPPRARVPAFLRRRFSWIESSPIRSRLASGMAWSLAGTVASRFLTLIASMLVARILGKPVYGELGMIQSTFGMFGVFAGFGLGVTATKHVAEFYRKNPARAGGIISLSGLFTLGSAGVMAACLYVLSPWLAEHTIRAPHLAGALRVGTLVLFLNTLIGAQAGALAGFEAFRSLARVNFIAGALTFPALVAGAHAGGLLGVVWGLVAGLAVNWTLGHLALRREIRRHGVSFSLRGCIRELPVLWSFSLPAALAGALVGPVDWMCGALLVNQPGGYSEMGIFTAANQWFTALMFLPGLLGMVMLPVLSEQLGRSSKASGSILLLSVKVNTIFVLPFILLAGGLSPVIMSFYGEGFGEGWPTLVVVLLTGAILAYQMPVGQIIIASGRMWTGFLMNSGWALVYVACTIYLRDLGAVGLASSRAIAYTVHALWTFGYAYRLVKGKAG